MQKRWLLASVSLLTILILIGVYLFLIKNNTPDTPAYNDKFTRDFLVKDAETPEGYHLFKSGTEKYTILFPESYYMAKASYYRKTGLRSKTPNTENVFIRQEGISPKENGMIKGVQLFLKPDGNNVIDATLNVLLDDINAPEGTEVHQIKDENKTVYYAENTEDYHADDGSRDTYFYLYGFITDNHSDQALYFELEDTCFYVDTKKCKIDFEEEKKMGLEMMKSLEFK